MSQANYIDTRLTNVSNAWLNDDQDFIATKIFPIVTVAKKTFKIAGYDKENLRIPSSSLRTGESKAKRVNRNRVDQQMGPLQEHSLSDFVTDEDQSMTDDPYDALSDSAENILQKMALIDENDLASTLASTSIITNNVTLSGTSQWNDYANSTPFNDIKTAVLAIRPFSIKPANTIVFSWEVWLTLVDHPDFLDRIKWSEMGVMGEADFLKLMAPYGITQLFIGKVLQNTAVEGQTDTIATVWGKNAWIAYVTPKPGLKQVNGGYRFTLENGRKTTREGFNNPPGDEIVQSDYYDYELVNSGCFYLIKNAIA